MMHEPIEETKTAAPTPTPAAVPVYPVLPPLPAFPTPPDPLKEEKAAYAAALLEGAKAVELVGRAMFDDYIVYVKKGRGREKQCYPQTNENDKFKTSAILAFKKLIESVDGDLQVEVHGTWCDVKVRAVAAMPTPSPAAPSAPSAPLARPEPLLEADKAFSGPSKDKLAFLNKQLRALKVGDQVWLNNGAGFQLARIIEWGSRETTIIVTTDAGTKLVQWKHPYQAWPLYQESTVLVPCWNEEESRRLLLEDHPKWKFLPSAQTDLAVPVTDLAVGDYLSAKDLTGKPYLGKVILTSGLQIQIHYIGWASRWDEWIDRSSPRLRKKITPAGIFNFLLPKVPDEDKALLGCLAALIQDLTLAQIKARVNLDTPYSVTVANDSDAVVLSSGQGVCDMVYAVVSFKSYTLTVLSRSSSQTKNLAGRLQLVE